MEEACLPNLDDDTTTPTTSVGWSATASRSSSTSSGFDSSLEPPSTKTVSSSSSSCDFGVDSFPIMSLPVEVRSRIFNLLPQRQVPSLRLVSRTWREELDQFYEFSLNIYDTNTNFQSIKGLRCRECTIWKLTAALDTPSLFTHPAYLKSVKVYGPTSVENLCNLISASSNLEHLTLTRRANYPWYLNLRDCPGLAGLNELKYLRLNSEEQVSLHLRNGKDSIQKLPIPPMMDCFFPKLRHFEILKRFAVWQYPHYVTAILRFVARHSKTLQNLELDLIPLSCIALLDDESSEESEEDDGFVPMGRDRRRNSSISIDQIVLSDLCNLRLKKFCVTTKGSDCDIFTWKDILAQQKELRELRFDWLCRDPRAEIRDRVMGFPWVYFQAPVELSSQFLVHVELASLSMFCPGSRRVVPFDLSIFRSCKGLKSLILRCRENHAKVAPAELAAEFGPEENDNGNHPAEVENNPNGNEEVLLMINGSELPPSVEQLEIFRFPMLTEDLIVMVSATKLPSIRKLFLHECGKTGSFGVSADVLRTMAGLKTLKFLEVIGFNDGGGQRRSELEEVFQTVGIPYEGQDTWLEFSDGSSSAHESLKVLLSESE